ncbi:MAG: sulfurtransferase TusA family protein [Geminicoccaceae bacterium]
MSVEADEVLDASGLSCPLPVLKAQKRLATMASGCVLQLISTDPAAVRDVTELCAARGHVLVKDQAEAGRYAFWIKRA